MSFLKRTNESEVEAMDNEPNAEKKARRHAVLMRGVVTPILGLLAVRTWHYECYGMEAQSYDYGANAGFR